MDHLVCVDDFEKEASLILAKNPKDYFYSGADDEITVKANSTAFSRWLIRPRVLVDVSNRDLSTTVLGKKVKVPLGVSPSAFQRLSHSDGECGSAKVIKMQIAAAEAVGGIFVLSVFATSSYEEVAAVAPNGRRWMQFYLHKDRSITLDLISRAEASGFEAMVVTIDAQFVGNRRSSRRDPLKFPSHLRLPNAVPNSEQDELNLFSLHDDLDHGVTWEAISWLKSVSRLPIVLKGIQTPEDARLAVQHGADAVFVSTHGGRQIDTAVPSINILQDVVKEVGGKCEIYMDGGVRRGTDIFKALALGANMVFVGRPIIYGLAVGGAAGATKVLQTLSQELDLTMALSGVRSVGDINQQFVEHSYSPSRL